MIDDEDRTKDIIRQCAAALGMISIMELTYLKLLHIA